MVSEEIQFELRKILETSFESPEPFARTGKSELYLARTKDGRQVVVKALISPADSWRSAFLREVEISREIEGKSSLFCCPKMIHVDPEKYFSVWEYAEGESLGLGRFFSEGISREQSEAILGAVQGISLLRPERRVGREEISGFFLGLEENLLIPQALRFKLRSSIEAFSGNLEFTHGDLLSSNLLLSNRRVSILDWEHAGMRLPFFDLAFLWVMGLFSETHRQTVLDFVTSTRAPSLFWINVILILLKELKIHEELEENSGYKSERSLQQIKRGLRDSLEVAVSGFLACES